MIDFGGYSDYRRMEEHDQYEPVGLDESLEDERDLDQIMADRRAAEIELDTRDGTGRTTTHRKLPHLLHDQGLVTLKLLLLFSITPHLFLIFFSNFLSRSSPH